MEHAAGTAVRGADSVDPVDDDVFAGAGAGVEIHAVPGERVTRGQKLFTLHTDTPERFERALESLTGGATIDPDAADGTGAREDVVIDRID